MKQLLFSSETDILEYARSVEDTPFYLYDQATIETQCKHLKNSFSWAPDFQNYFAVKATPNPSILRVIMNQGMGVDCSSYAELLLAEAVGFRDEKIFFTSNNTKLMDYEKAIELGAILNLDDASHVNLLHENNLLPEHICFRYNPGSTRTGNNIIGNPVDAKFGLTKQQLFQSYATAKSLGCKRFSLHTMIISNCLNEDELYETAKMMFTLIKELKETLNVTIYRVNLGGGIGIPYKPSDKNVDFLSLTNKIRELYTSFLAYGEEDSPIKISLECGRFITGPAGILVTRIINKKTTYKNYLGVDASIANLMRPALYGSYHHITHIEDKSKRAFNQESLLTRDVPMNLASERNVYDVVGSLCENNDKLATDRYIGNNTDTNICIGDLLIIHDVGAHGSAMSYNYNGRLRCAEYLVENTKQIKLIRRAETHADLFSTIVW